MLKTHPYLCCSSHRDSSFEECRMTWLEKPPNRHFSSMIFQFFREIPHVCWWHQFCSSLTPDVEDLPPGFHPKYADFSQKYEDFTKNWTNNILRNWGFQPKIWGFHQKLDEQHLEELRISPKHMRISPHLYLGSILHGRYLPGAHPLALLSRQFLAREPGWLLHGPRSLAPPGLQRGREMCWTLPSGNDLHSYWKWPLKFSGFSHE